MFFSAKVPKSILASIFVCSATGNELQPGRILVPHAINCSLTPTWLPTESEAPSIYPRSRVFSSRFPGASRFPWRFAFPGDSSVLALRFSWRFFFPGGSRFLAISVSWRFPCHGDCQHVLRLAGRGLVVLQLKVGSWLLLVPPRRLVKYLSAGCPLQRGMLACDHAVSV